MENIIEVNVTVDRQLFYDTDSMYGVYALSPNTEKDKIPLNSFGNFVVNGTTPELTIGDSYDIEIQPETTVKYGDGYSFVAVKVKRPKTVKEQQEYVQSLVTETQYEEIIKEYPDALLLDLFEGDKVDHTNLKGIGQITVENIKHKLINNLEIHEALVELKDLDMTFDAMKRLIDHFGSAKAVIQKVRDNIYNLCEVSLFGFMRVDKYALARGDSKTNDNRIRSAIVYLLEQDASSGHSWMKLDVLKKELLNLLRIDQKFIDAAIKELEQKGDRVQIMDSKIFLAHNHFYESTINSHLKNLKEQRVTTVDTSEIEERIHEQELRNGFKYTEEQRNTIQKAIDNNVLVINGFGGTGKCLLGDSLVYTDKGILKVEDIPKHYEVGVNGEVNTSIVSYKTSGKKEIRDTSHWYNMGLSKTIRIETSQGYGVEGTPEHPLLVVNKNGDLEYKELQHITTSDIVSVSKENNLWGNDTSVSKRLAYIMGVLTGDGSLSESSTQNKYFSYTNKTIFKEVNNIIGKEFDSDVLTSRDSDTSLKHSCYDKYAYDLMKSLGLSMKKSIYKEIPYSILQSPKEMNVAFLQGLFDTDAHMCSKNGFEYCTASKVLAKQVHIVLLNLGIVSRLKTRTNNQKDFNHYGNEYYYIYVSGEHTQKLHDLKLFRFDKVNKDRLHDYVAGRERNTNIHVLYNMQEKIKRLHRELLLEDWYCKRNGYKVTLKDGSKSAVVLGSMDTRGRNISTKNILDVLDVYSFKDKDASYIENISSNLFFDKIVSVAQSEDKKIVYDFTVPETHSFVANGIVNHNTAIVKGVTEALSDYDYMSASLSGKAAQILSKQGLKSMTIHRMLGVNPEGGFIHNESFPLPYDIVIIDEASMANNFLFHSVITALKESARLIVVGDNGQLPSIGTGAIFNDLVKYGTGFARQELTMVHRQAQKSGILSVANTIRGGKQINGRYDFTNQVFGELKDMMLIPMKEREGIKETVLQICKSYKHGDLLEFQVITGLRERGDISVKELNLAMQPIFNDMSQPFISRGGYDYRVGDKIIQNGNNYNVGENEDVSVFNGSLGMIVKIDFDSDNSRQNHKIHINFEDIDETIVYERADLSQIELAYAISVHKSQGSTIKHVIFAFDYSSYMLLSREFVYTGITRASEGCVLIAENSALHYAVENTVGEDRRTFLKEMLIESNN